MITLGIILVIVAALLDTPPIIMTLGIILLVIGVVLTLLGAAGRAVGGRKTWY